MLPIPTRHLQIQYQQVADASAPGQASANSIPANCRYFHLPTRHLQIQYQLVADASNPDQASTNPIPANCRCFQPRPGICSSNFSKLQMLPTPTRHLQIQYQQIADASEPDQASTSPIPANCRCFQPQDRHLQIQFQQVVDASDPDQASAYPILASCRCFRPQPGICKSNFSKLQMLPTPARHLQLSKTTNQRCPPVNFLLKFAGGHLYFIFIVSLFHQITIYVSF